MIRASLAGFLATMVFVGSAVAAHCPLQGNSIGCDSSCASGSTPASALAYVQVAPARMAGAEPDAGPVGKPEDIVPFVLANALDAWPASK